LKFGIFFEVSVPRPWTADAERTVYENALEQARLADELGFDWVWAVEHHFLEEYSHCSAPEVLLAAVAAQTERIRVGHGVVVCVPQINHPIRAAERAAVLDIVSGGRLEFGTGRSSTWTELGGFQADPDETKKTWDEFVRVIPRMWTDERFSYQGRCFSMPERAVLPKPVQKPHPPLWVAVTTPGTELDAAQRGMGCLGVATAGFEEQERRTRDYHRVIRRCEPVGSAVNDCVTTLNFLYCHEDPKLASERGTSLIQAFGLSNAHLLFTREAYATSAYELLAGLSVSRRSDAGSPGEERGLPEGIAVGDPDWIVKQIRTWESIGIDGLNFLVNAMEVVPQHQVLDSMRLFAREVMPKFGPRPERPPAAAPAQAARGTPA
jgi:alkanesulfonate monooxygenase SsuD/methylene tetrahydromethanopterin reductase-like flavin-dependent oxidoreductase (luciferase family)